LHYTAGRTNEFIRVMSTTNQLPHHRLGDTVTHVGSIGGMKSPEGTVTRDGKFNSLLSSITYGVTFPHGYFLVPEDQLRPGRMRADSPAQ